MAVPPDEDTTLRLTLDTEYRLEANAWYGHEIETIPASEDGFYPEGTPVRLRAVEGPPEEFIGWSGGDAAGTDPTVRVTMGTGRYVEAVFAAGTSEMRPGEPVNVSLRWNAGDPDHDRRYVRVPPGADELELRFSTNSLTERAEAGLFVTHRRDPWPWDVDHADADRTLRDGVETITVSPAADGRPAAYFVLVRSAEPADGGVQRLEGTLVATVSRDANRPPQAVGTLEDRTLARDGTALVLDVARAFADPDGDLLTYTAVSSSPGVAAVTLAGSTLTVTPVSPGAATVTVTATDLAGASAMQQFGVAVAARATFTDHPITPGATAIKAIHFLELRERIDALRAGSRLLAFRWTDPTLVPGVTPVRVVHLTDLRMALAEAYAAAGRPAPTYTDTSPAAGTGVIQAAHVMELRDAVVALGTAPAPPQVGGR